MIELTGNRLYQWEIGRELTGFDGTHAQFANKGDSIAEIYSVANGKIKIPDKYLQSGGDLIVFDCNVDENSEVETILSTRIFPVQDKPKPKHYTPTEAAEALGIVKRLTEEAKAAAAAALASEERSSVHAQDAYNEANRAKQYAEIAESGSNRALIVTFSQEDYYADYSVGYILTAAESGRDVFLKLPGEESYLPLVSVDEDGWYAQFCRYGEKNVLVYEIRDDSMVTINTISLDRLDDSKTDGSHVWSAEKIISEIDKRSVKIDDTKVGADAWSSKNIVDKLCPSFEQTGTLVQCEPVEGYPLSVKAKEDGHVEGVTVTVCGKNLYNPSEEGGYPLIKNHILRHASGTYASSNTFSATEKHIPAMHLRGKTISIRNAPAKTEGTTSTGGGIAFYDENKKYISGTNLQRVTVPSNTCWIRFCINMDFDHEAQIELGEVVTDYEPYCGNSSNAAGSKGTVTGVKGINNVFAYSGDNAVEITVVGKADPVAIIEKLTSAVLSLGGNI